MRPFLRIYRKGKGNNDKSHKDTRTNKTRQEDKKTRQKAGKQARQEAKQESRTKAEQEDKRRKRKAKHASSL